MILAIMMGAAALSWIGVIVYWQLDLMDIRKAERASRHGSRTSSMRKKDHRPHKLDLMVQMPGQQGAELQKLSESEAKAMHVSPAAVQAIVLHPDASSTGGSSTSNSGRDSPYKGR